MNPVVKSEDQRAFNGDVFTSVKTSGYTTWVVRMPSWSSGRRILMFLLGAPHFKVVRDRDPDVDANS